MVMVDEVWICSFGDHASMVKGTRMYDSIKTTKNIDKFLVKIFFDKNFSTKKFRKISRFDHF